MKKIQRLTDNKYLVNAVSDIWTDSIDDARVYRAGEAFVAKLKILNRGLKLDQIKEIELESVLVPVQ